MSAIVMRMDAVLEALRDVEPRGKDPSLHKAYRSGEQKVHGGTGRKLTPDEKSARRVHPTAGDVGARSAALRKARHARAKVSAAKDSGVAVAAHKELKTAVGQARKAHKSLMAKRGKMKPGARALSKKKFTDPTPSIRKKEAGEREAATRASAIRARRKEKAAELVGKRHAKEAPFLPGEVKRYEKDKARKKREAIKKHKERGLKDLKQITKGRRSKATPPPLPPSAPAGSVRSLPSAKDKARARRSKLRTVKAVRSVLKKGA